MLRCSSRCWRSLRRSRPIPLDLRRSPSTRPACLRAACRRHFRIGRFPPGSAPAGGSATCRRGWAGCPRLMPGRVMKSSPSTRCGNGTSWARRPPSTNPRKSSRPTITSASSSPSPTAPGRRRSSTSDPSRFPCSAPSSSGRTPTGSGSASTASPTRSRTSPTSAAATPTGSSAQLAHVVRTYKVDGFWLDGYAPAHLHTFDEATRAAFRSFSGGREIPTNAVRSTWCTTRLPGRTWPGTSRRSSTWPTGCAPRSGPRTRRPSCS